MSSTVFRELWGHKLVRPIVGAFALGLLVLNLLEFPRQVLVPDTDIAFYATCEYYAAHHSQFGTEVLQNVGPYGYLHYGYVFGGYLPVQKILLKTLYRLGLILLILWAASRLRHPILKLCWWAAFFIFQPCTWPLALPGMPDFVHAQEMDWEQDYGYLVAYLGGLYLLQKRKDWVFLLASNALLFFLAAAALTKHTTFVLAACAVAAAVLQKALRKELLGAAWTAMAFVLFLSAHWLITGQALANFPGFVRGIFAFAAGYNEAFNIPGPALAILIGALVAGLLCLRSLYNFRALNQGLPRTLLEFSLIFVAWKHGFVLAHFSHVMTFFFPMVCLGILIFYLLLPIKAEPAPASPLLPRAHRFMTSPAVLAAAFGLVLLALERSAHFYSERNPGQGGGYYPAYFFNSLKRNCQWLVSPQLQLAKMREDLAKSQALFSLPDIKAAVGQRRVDFLGSETGWLMLNGLNYWCRPMPMTYAACNESLARANETFFRDPRVMPDFVVCSVEGATGRFVPQMDALALRALVDNYVPVLTERGLVLLKKNPGPPRDRLEKQLLFDGNVKFGDTVHLNASSNQTLWAEVEIQRSLLGKVLSFVYKPRLCYIGYRCVGSSADHEAQKFIMQLGPSGCMITPLIENNADLLNFYASPKEPGQERGLGDLRRIESFSFYFQQGDGPFFQKEIRLRLYTVPPPTQRIELHEASK